MKKQKQPELEDQVIYDLSDLLEFHTMKILYDGNTRKRANLYLVKVRAATETAYLCQTTQEASAGGFYVLKIV